MHLVEGESPRFSLYHVHQMCRDAIGFLKRRLFYEPMVRARCDEIGKNFTILRGFPYISGHFKLCIGRNVRMDAETSIVTSKAGDDPIITIGDNTKMGPMLLSCAKEVRIGANVIVGHRVFIMDNPGHPLDPIKRRTEPVGPADIRPVCIEEDAYIGDGSVIFPGVTVGRGAIVGPGSMVTKDIPPFTYASGSPAKVRHELEVSA